MRCLAAANTRWLQQLFSIFSFIALALSASAQPPATTAPEPEIVDLPAFNVSADRVLPPLEKWRYVKIPGYEIISNASAKNTRQFVEQFHLLQQVAVFLLPSLENQPSVPTYIVLCGRGESFEHFKPTGQDFEADQTGSIFARDKERTAIVVDYTMGGFVDSPGDGEAATSVSGNDSPFRGFSLQYFRNLIQRGMGKNTPLWVEEGLVQLLASTEYDKTRLVIGVVGGDQTSAGGTAPIAATGNPTDPASYEITSAAAGTSSNSPRAIAGLNAGQNGAFNAILRGTGLIPLEKFFARQPQAVIEGQDLEYAVYKAQAYLFTHMCLYSFSAKKKYMRPYFELVSRATRGPVTEAVFQEVFKMSFKDMQVVLRGYIGTTAYRAEEFTNINFKDVPPFDLNYASDSDSSRIAGEVLRLSGDQEGSLNRLVAPYVRGERDAELLAALGLAELYADHADRARKFLEAAATGKTTRARALFELGKLRLNEAKIRATAEKRPLTADEFRQAIAPLNNSLKCPPASPESFLVLARAWRDAPVAPEQKEFAPLVAGAMQFPKNLELVYHVAETALKYGYVQESRALIAHGLKFAPDSATKGNFERLAALLPVEKKTASVK